jgi:hypothetical protein
MIASMPCLPKVQLQGSKLLDKDRVTVGKLLTKPRQFNKLASS